MGATSDEQDRPRRLHIAVLISAARPRWERLRSIGVAANFQSVARDGQISTALTSSYLAGKVWCRPAWLIEQARIHLYPMLWEATRTAWQASPDAERHSLSQQLVDHTNHVLRNSFREQLGIPPGPTRITDWKVKPTAVAEASIEVDGDQRPALHIDTDPFVYAFGFRVDDHTVSTNVFPRDSLPLLNLALTTLG